jgi:perosamine synthetase
VPEVIEVARPWMGSAEQHAAAEVIASGWVAQGPMVARFEQGVADAVGARGAVAVSSATAGLHLALLVAGIGPGDEVVVPSLSFIATANSVVHAGATPVFADVDPATQNVTVATVAAALSPDTRAVTVVHQGGVPADVEAIRQLCEPMGIAVIEDAACASGSTVYGRAVGGGDTPLAVFSFHARKLLTTGEGGMVVTSDRVFERRLRALRDHGVDTDAYARHAARSTRRERYLEPAFNYRMTDIQGAIGVVQVGRLDEMVERRRMLAARYRAGLADIDGLVAVTDPPFGRANFQSFWITLPDDFPLTRDDLLDDLGARGVSGRRGFMAAHLEPAYARAASRHVRVPLPVTEHLTGQSLILPLHHGLSIAEVDRVVELIHAAAAPHRTPSRQSAAAP